MKYLVILSALMLGGCETFYANAIQSYNDGRNAVRGYVADNFEDRRWIRQRCREGLAQREQVLRAEDKHEEADALLASRYPPVITVEEIDSEEMTAASSINTPHICGGSDAEEDAPGAEPTS